MKILVIEARYYEAISEDLLQGALAKLQAAFRTSLAMPKKRKLVMMGMLHLAALFAARRRIMIMSAKKARVR